MRIFIFIDLIALSLNFVTAEKRNLHIMGFLPMTGKLFRGGPACLLAAKLALQHVNDRQDILEGFDLDLIWRDSKCAAGPAVNEMYEMLYSEPTKLMIFGPGCSTEAEVLAQASPAWNITILSWGASSPLLSDKEKFPRFFRVVAPETKANIAKVELARYFGWKRISTLNVALDYYSAVTDNLVKLVKQNEMSVISQEIFDQDPLTRIQSLKEKDARIIMAAGYSSHGKMILCAAYKAGLYGPKIVWMFPGYYHEKWWESPVPKVSCTVEQLALVAEGSILNSFFFASTKIESGIANLTVPEYWKLYHEDEGYQYITEYEYVSPMCYDAIWGIGLALNCTDKVLKAIGHNKTLDEFEYSDVDIGDIMTSCTRNVSFLGLSGQVEFDITGEPTKNVKIDQIRDGKKVLVGIYRTDVADDFIEWFNGGIVWKEGVAPRDSTLVTEIEVLIPAHLYILMSCVAAMGIVLAAILVVFNIVHRNNKFVKMSSPNINNILLLGCILVYTSVFTESFEEHTTTLCKVRICTFSIGFSMAFGALFSKTWRVYKIFANKKLLKIRIRDYQLVGIVLAIVGVLGLVLLVWEIIDPIYLETRFLTKEVYLIGNDAEIHPYIHLCTSKYYSYFSWTLCIMEGALLSFAAFLSFETRKVKIAALNDSQLIGMCLYNVVVLSAVGLTLSLVLGDKVILLYGITSGILIIGTTASQLIVFIPKIMVVYFPHRVDIDELETHTKGSRLGSNATATTLPDQKLTPRERTETVQDSGESKRDNSEAAQDCGETKQDNSGTAQDSGETKRDNSKAAHITCQKEGKPVHLTVTKQTKTY